MKKRMIKNLMLVVVMVVLCVAVGVTASAETWGDYEYRVIDDVTVEITKYTGNEIEVEIPAEIDGKTVTVIGDHAFEPNRPNLVKVVIPEGVTTIGDSAFSVCEKLISVEIPNSVVNIEERAFSHCHRLEKIYLPYSVQHIGNRAFEGCFSMVEYCVDENNENYSADDCGVLFNKDKTILIQYPCSNSREVYNIPESVTTIADFGVYYAFHLKNINIPDGVINIGRNAFEGCFNLRSIDIPASVSTINSTVFSFCIGLTDIIIPNTVKTISKYALSECYNADKIYIESMDAEIEEGALNFSSFNIDGLSYEESIELFVKALFEGEYYIDENDEVFEHIVFFDEPTYLSTIYCHEGSKAQVYAETNDMDYVPTHFFEGEWTYDYDNMIRYRKCIHCDELETEQLETTGDGEVDIIAPTNPDTDFTVDVIEDYVIIEETISNNVAGDFEIVKAFDINLKNKDGVHVQPDGTVKVKLPLDWSKDGIYKVYRINDDGTLTDMNAYREGSHMVFDTDHFSVYVIVDESEKTDEPTTPDEPQEETKDSFFSKLIDLIKSFIELIESMFKK